MGLRKSVADKLREIAQEVLSSDKNGSGITQYGNSQYGNSEYLNIPYHLPQTTPSLTKYDVRDGPPSLINDINKGQSRKDRIDTIRQGPYPGPVDIFTKDYPVTDTTFPNDEVKTGPQGERRDTTTPGGRNEDRWTVPFDPGALTNENYDEYYA